MKKLFKAILVAIPALLVAAAVGMTTIGCGDDTTMQTATPDLATPAAKPDLAMTAHDMAGD